jgi:hypothetical protein
MKNSIEKNVPIDTALSNFWNPVQQNSLFRRHYTYRYNLFKHIGNESFIGNNKFRVLECLKLSSTNFYHYWEEFDWKCYNKMISPCDMKKINEIFDLNLNPNVDIPLKYEYRDLLMNSLNLSVHYNFFNDENVSNKTFFNSSCYDICFFYYF